MAAELLRPDQSSGSPPMPPELPVNAPRRTDPRWPAWFAIAGLFGGLAVVLVVVGVLAAVFTAFGVDVEAPDPAFVITATVLQSGIMFAFAWVLARTVGPVHLRDFGLRRAAFWRSLLWAIGLGVIYFAFLAVFTQFVDLKDDTVPFDLGADKGDLAMVAFVFVAVIIAPIFEELFFRGFLFKSLRSSFNVGVAALIAGTLFGLMHWDFTVDRLPALVPLSLFGILLCLLYARTGTIYSTIAVHATNNMLAAIGFADKEHSHIGVWAALIAWAVVMLISLFGSRLTDRRAVGHFDLTRA